MRSLRSRNIESSSDENIKEKKTRKRKSLNKTDNFSDIIDETIIGSKRKGRKKVNDDVDLDNESLPEVFLTTSSDTSVEISNRIKIKKKQTKSSGKMAEVNGSDSDQDVPNWVKNKNPTRKITEIENIGSDSDQEVTIKVKNKKKRRKSIQKMTEISSVEVENNGSDTNQEDLNKVKNKKKRRSTQKMTEISLPQSNESETDQEVLNRVESEISRESTRKISSLEESVQKIENSLISSDTDQDEIPNKRRLSKLKKSKKSKSITDISSSESVIKSEEKSSPEIHPKNKLEAIESIVIDDSLCDPNATYDIINSSRDDTIINRSGEWAVEKIDVPSLNINERIHLHSEKKNTPRKRWVKFNTTTNPESPLLRKSFVNTPNKSTGKKSAVKSVPNFKAIHQKAYDKLENLKEYSERKKERAENLLSGKNPTKKTISKDLFSNIKAQINEIFKESPEPKELNFNDTYQGSSVFKPNESKTPFKINKTFAGHTPKVIDKKTKTPKFIKDKVDKALRISNSIPKTPNLKKIDKSLNINNSIQKIPKSIKKTVSFGNKTKSPLFKPLQKATHIPVKIVEKKENIPKIVKPTSIVKPTVFTTNIHKSIFTKGALNNELENKPKSIFTKGHVLAVANKTKGEDKLANRSNRRDQIKGVRTNRRFELLMQMRNN